MTIAYAQPGSPAYYASDNLWGVGGGPNALVPFAQQAQQGYPTGLPTFQQSAPQAIGGDGGGGSYSPSNTSAQDTRAGRDANAQNTSGGLIGGPSLASGGSGPSTSGAGTNSFGGVFIGSNARTAEVAQIEESAQTWRWLALAAAGMSALGFAYIMLRR